MSGTADWSPDKVSAVAARLVTYKQARAALAALALPSASATVSLYVATSEGSVNFDFQLVVAEAAGFFTPVVNAIGDELTAQGVDLSQLPL